MSTAQRRVEAFVISTFNAAEGLPPAEQAALAKRLGWAFVAFAVGGIATALLAGLAGWWIGPLRALSFLTIAASFGYVGHLLGVLRGRAHPQRITPKEDR